MRLPTTAHTSRPWRIHELARDFRVEDVWSLPTPGGPDDFRHVVRLISSFDPAHDVSSPIVRALFAARWKLGAVFGWDRAVPGDGGSPATLRDRLPAELRGTGTNVDVSPFVSLYLLHDEWAAEIVNRTVHGVLHLGWLPDGAGGYHAQMAVLVKRNGLLGTAYMAAITPFRYLIVYPLMMREIGRAWRAQRSAAPSVTRR